MHEPTRISFARERLNVLLETLEQLVGGDTRCSLAISPLHDELDAIAFGVNVLADELRWAHARITDAERAKADELRDALAHLGRVAMLDVLAGSLAHDINQPLTAARTNAAAAARLLEAASPSVSYVRQILPDIVAEIQRAADVVQRMRTLLKKDATPYEPVELNGTVTDVLHLVRPNAEGRRIRLDVDLAVDLHLVLGNRAQIQQVVLNLLINAFDAVQECTPADRRVSVRTSRDDFSDAIHVGDTGAGLSDEALARLFEPTRTTKRDGLGLGLWICRGIVTAHGGTLEAMRNAGGGMTFSARFPSASLLT